MPATNQLRQLRREARLSLQEAADLLGIKRGRYLNWERGLSTPGGRELSEEQVYARLQEQVKRNGVWNQELARLRYEADLSKGEAAELLGVPESTYTKWERTGIRPEGGFNAVLEQARVMFSEHITKEQFQTEIRQARIISRLSRVRFAKLLGYTTGQTWAWEVGNYCPRMSNRGKILRHAWRTAGIGDGCVHYTHALPPEKHSVMQYFLRALCTAGKRAREAKQPPDINHFLQTFRDYYSELV